MAVSRVTMTTEGTGAGFNAAEIQENNKFQEFLLIQMETTDWRPVSINFNDSTNGNLSYEVYGTDLLGSSADNWRTITEEATGSLTDLSSLTLLAPSLFTNPDNDGTSESLVFDELVQRFQTFVITTASSGNKFRVTEFQGSPTAVPLPAALPLLATAIGGLGILVGLKRRKRSPGSSVSQA